MFTWTETPIAELWRNLRYLESPANVARLLDGSIRSGRNDHWRSGGDLDARAHTIAACIRQADQYYTAAEAVGLATLPLLQFYGAESLAKAAILATVPLGEEIALEYHGLSTRPLQSVEASVSEELKAYRADPSQWNVEQEFAVVNEGVFPRLCTACGDPLPKVGSVVFLKELLRMAPDLAEPYERHYGEPSNSLQFSGRGPEWDSNNHLVLRLRKPRDKSDPKTIIPELGTEFVEGKEDQRVFRYVSNAALTSVPAYLAFEKGTVSGIHIVRRHPSGLAASMPVIFCALFIVGNIVRYKPSFWMREIESTGSGTVALVEALCNLAKRRLTNDALELIWQEKFTYATPAYLS
jgi:hypothetical protein